MVSCMYRFKFKLTVLFLLAIFSHLLFANEKWDYRFHQLSVNDGLSQYDVSSLLQDERGYIWIGTYDGLNRFDGYNVRVYRHDSDNSNSIGNNRILCLTEDRHHNILIGTSGGGLSVYHSKIDRFYNTSSRLPAFVSSICEIEHDSLLVGTTDGRLFFYGYPWEEEQQQMHFEANEIRISGFSGSIEYVSSIRKLDEDMILVGFREGGLMQLDLLRQTGKEVTTRFIPEVNSGVNSVYQDSEHRIWAATYNGVKVFRYSRGTRRLHEDTPPKLNQSLNGKNITDITQDGFNNYWISTFREGVFFFDPHTEDLIHYDSVNSLLPSDECRQVLVDRSQVLWIGTHDDGCTFADLSQKRFHGLRFDINNQEDLAAREKPIFAMSILKDSQNRLWIGTEGDGLLYRDTNSGQFSRPVVTDGSSFITSSISALIESSSGHIWIGSWSGLYVAHSNELVQNPIRVQPVSNEDFFENSVYSIVEDENLNLWIGTRKGMYRLSVDEAGQILQEVHYTQQDHALSSDWIMSLALGAESGVLWAGSQGGGLMKIQYRAGSDDLDVMSFKKNNQFPLQLSNNNVWNLLIDGQDIWAATDEGLDLIQERNGSFQFVKAITIKEGLPTNKVVSIIKDEERNLWLGTGLGLCWYSNGDSSLITFDYFDGLQSNTFTEAAFYDRDGDGYIYIGGIKGVNYFHPREIDLNLYPPKSNLTELRVFNRPVSVGEAVEGKILLTQDISYTKSMTLNHKHRNFSIGFVSFHFAAPRSNQYAYMLEGFDKDWTRSTGEKRLATYSNLKSGNYTFKVKSANNDGLWETDPATLGIRVTPPPWQSWWAIVIYLFILLAVVWAIFRYFIVKIRFEHELLLEKNRREQERELTEYKLNFFTHISHELRTPLTLITTPIQEIKRHVNHLPEVKSLVEILEINSARLLKLIEQLLKFRKTEKLQTTLEVSHADLCQLIKNIMKAFNPLAASKNINFKYESEQKTAFTYFDQEKLEIVSSNLISNALKYTPAGGEVTVCFQQIKRDKQHFNQIKVIDNGSGIPPEKLEKIFDLYYHEGQEVGFGIGLALVKNLITVHKGDIHVESEAGKGTIFTVEIPASKSAYSDHLVIQPYSDSTLVSQLMEQESLFGEVENQNLDTVSEEEKPLLLVVEDNHELRHFVSTVFMADFNVLVAKNGREGMEKALSFLPDIIISDVMMPIMDGIELCRKIKSTELTSHIPIVLLTAKSSDESEMVGLDVGADDYIIKPFNLQNLKARVDNLLAARKLLQEKFSRQLILEPTSKVLESMDEKFIQRALVIVTDNLGDPDFTIARFARELGVSRSQLQRKIKGLTSETPMEFMKSIRLKRAAQLLRDSQLSITQICYEVGFNYPAHFSQQFQKQFGQTPKKYRTQG